MASLNCYLKQQLEHGLDQLKTFLSDPARSTSPNDSVLQQLVYHCEQVGLEVDNDIKQELNNISQELDNFQRIQRWSQMTDMPKHFEDMQTFFKDEMLKMGQPPAEVLEDSLKVRLERKWPDRIQQRISAVAAHLNNILNQLGQFGDFSSNGYLHPLQLLQQQFLEHFKALFKKTLCVINQPGKVLDKNKGPWSTKKTKKSKVGNYTMTDVDENDYLMAVRILIDEPWKDKLKLSEVTAQIISLNDLQKLDNVNPDLGRLLAGGCMKKVEMIKPTMTIKPDKSQIAIFEIYEPARKDNATPVKDSFYCFLLKVKCDFNGNPFYIYTTSSIFGLIVRSSQAVQYQLGMLWNCCFADGLKMDVQVPFNQFLNWLGKVFRFYTGAEKALDPDELVYLGHKIMDIKSVDDINQKTLSKETIGPLYKNGQSVDTKFSDWFFQIMEMIKTRFLDDWNEGLIRFADRATAEKALLGVPNNCCYVRFPETFEEALCFDFIKSKDDNGTPNYDHLLLNLTGSNNNLFTNRQHWGLIKLISITKDLEHITEIYPNHVIELIKQKNKQSGVKRKIEDLSAGYQRLRQKYSLLYHDSTFMSNNAQYNVKKMQFSLGTDSKSDGSVPASSLPGINHFVCQSPDGQSAAPATLVSSMNPIPVQLQNGQMNCQNLHQFLNETFEMPNGFVEYIKRDIEAQFQLQPQQEPSNHIYPVSAPNPTQQFNGSQLKARNVGIQDFTDEPSEYQWVNNSADSTTPMDTSGTGGSIISPSTVQFPIFHPNLIQSFPCNPKETIQLVACGNINANNFMNNCQPAATAVVTTSNLTQLQQQQQFIPTGVSQPQFFLPAPFQCQNNNNSGLMQIVYNQNPQNGQIIHQQQQQEQQQQQQLQGQPQQNSIQTIAGLGPGQQFVQVNASPVPQFTSVQSPSQQQFICPGSVDQRVPTGLTPAGQNGSNVFFNTPVGPTPNFATSPVGPTPNFATSPVGPTPNFASSPGTVYFSPSPVAMNLATNGIMGVDQVNAINKVVTPPAICNGGQTEQQNLNLKPISSTNLSGTNCTFGMANGNGYMTMEGVDMTSGLSYATLESATGTAMQTGEGFQFQPVLQQQGQAFTIENTRSDSLSSEDISVKNN